MAILRGTAFLAVILCAAFVNADEPKPIEIPLKDIWAWEMPGTKDVRDLEPDKFSGAVKKLPSDKQFRLLDESYTQQIRNSLDPKIPVKQGRHKLPEPKPAFTVIGEGHDALKAAYSVLVDKKEPTVEFPKNSNLSVVFFSYQSGSYVYIENVRQKSNNIEISYRFVPHLTANVSEHFALIPVGKLSAGQYRVTFKQLPMDPTYLQPNAAIVNEDWATSTVCQPFSFSVK